MEESCLATTIPRNILLGQADLLWWWPLMEDAIRDDEPGRLRFFDAGENE
jgi:hypothetical protein